MASILVIEDNPANMKLALLLLHSAGYMTLSANNGLERRGGSCACRRAGPRLCR